MNTALRRSERLRKRCHPDSLPFLRQIFDNTQYELDSLNTVAILAFLAGQPSLIQIARMGLDTCPRPQVYKLSKSE